MKSSGGIVKHGRPFEPAGLRSHFNSKITLQRCQCLGLIAQSCLEVDDIAQNLFIRRMISQIIFKTDKSLPMPAKGLMGFACPALQRAVSGLIFLKNGQMRQGLLGSVFFFSKQSELLMRLQHIRRVSKNPPPIADADTLLAQRIMNSRGQDNILRISIRRSSQHHRVRTCLFIELQIKINTCKLPVYSKISGYQQIKLTQKRQGFLMSFILD